MRHLLRRAAVTGLVLAAALGAASPASAAKEKAAGTLTIDGAGSSPILAWSWGVTNPVTVGSTTGGAGAGKLKLQDFNLTKRIDPLSLELTRATAALTRFPEAVVSVPIGGSLSPFAIEYRLRQVYVQSVQQSGSGDQSTESVSLVYGSFDQTIGNAPLFGSIVAG